MSDKPAMLFPGQGSQSIGMLSGLADAYPTVTDTFSEASDVLDFDLWKLVQEGPVATLNQTENTQPAMLAAGIAVARVWQEQGGREPVLLAGHSLGEYTALVAGGALVFSDAVKLVRSRGLFMQQAVPEGAGAMAAILGLEDQVVRDVCNQAAQGAVAEAVNFNSPGQVVIAGDAEAIARAVELAKEAGAKRALTLPVSVPSHCSLMKPAADRLAEELAGVTIKLPGTPVLHNVDVSVAESEQAIREKLVQQLYQPVQWVRTVQELGRQGATLLIEAGPGKVLAGLNRRIDKNLNTLPVTDPAGLEKALEAVNA